MILTCTSCSTRYYADDAAIGPAGRTVRCAACGFSWFAEPQLELREASFDAPPPVERAKPEPLTRERVERLRRAAAAPGPAPSAAAKFRAQQAERMRRDRARAVVAVWGATGVALAASATGAVAFRQEIAQVWPSSASAYAAVGLDDVNIYGLEFYDLTVERTFDGPTPVLLVSGEVRNIAGDAKRVPPVRVSLRDARSHEIFDLVNVVTNEPLAAGAATPFQIRVENPPADAVDLEATFADHAEVAYAGAAPRVSPSSGYNAQEPLLLTEPVEGEAAHPAPVGHEAAPASAPAASVGEDGLPGLRLRNG